MSFRGIQQTTVAETRTLRNKTLPATPAAWVRNPTWPALPTVTSAEETFVGLYLVPKGGCLATIQCGITGTGAYAVDWGDGSSDLNVNSGTIVSHTFSGSSGDNGYVTFSAAADTVNRTAHGYSDGMAISFDTVSASMGITAETIYYVVNSTANTFKLATTVGGAAINITNDGNGAILPYRIVTITVTRTNTSSSTINSINLSNVHGSTTTRYASGWLDFNVSISGTLVIGGIAGGGTGTYARYLERANIVRCTNTSFANLFVNAHNLKTVLIGTTGTLTDTSAMFYGCSSLTSGPLFNTASVTNMSYMFQNCYSLPTVPVFNTAAVTNMSYMFNGCNLLTSVPLFNTAAATNMSGMFNGCSSLTSVPFYNTAACTDMSYMFQSCTSLTSVPLLNTNLVTNMTNMFYNCYSLPTVPLFNTANVNNMSYMFYGCSSLTSVPLFTTNVVTTFSNTFRGCSSLTSVPLFVVSSVTNFTNMFYGCVSLTSVPPFYTLAANNMTGMFTNCSALTSVPLFITGGVTNFSNMFTNCSSLTYVPAFSQGSGVTGSSAYSSMFSGCSSLTKISIPFKYTFTIASCMLSASELNALYTLLPDGTSQTITVTGNYGISSDNPSIATNKGWTVTGS